ncbi:MAG: gliding motility-associated C-terminal domain-containing protein, partial [Bacteroidetes bacterium]|nr:gliding motility-associated C-terminal domain-containing protein [Bacteroidota bacterium]
SIRCLAVQANGDVQISWVAPADPNNFFAAAQIYHASTPAGPYVLVGTVNNYATTTWLHVGANANAGVQYYYMKSLSGCDGITSDGSTSDTLASMLLSVSNATLGFADLTWNAMHTPSLASAAGPYRVMRRSTGIGAYVQIGTTANLTFRDTITTCNVPLEYRIELDDNAPCTSISSADNDVFTYLGNIIGNPTLRCVSVNANGSILLTWENPGPVSFADFNEYEIWRDNGTGFALLDSVSNSAINTFTDNTANGNSQSYAYYLVTQSGCTGQEDNGLNGNILNSIYLTTAGVIGQANLSWLPLSTPLPATTVNGQYNVYSTYNAAGTLQLIGDTVQLVYPQTINDCDTLINHQVTVDDSFGCISRSNVASNTYTFTGNIVANPDLRCISVLPNGQIQLEWLTPSGSSDEFNEFEIFRNNGAGFVLYDSVSNFNQVSWTDAFANGNAQSYSYYIRSQSGCSGQLDNGSTSATLNSIYLTSTGVLGQATMNWNSHPLLPTSAASGYDVQTSYLTGNSLSLLTSTLGLTANEVINDCDTTLLHRIILADNSGCTSESNVDTNTFTYLGNVVDNPDLRCVSVLPNGQIQLEWLTPLSSSANFNEFEIYRNSGAGFVLYDSVSNFNQVSWTDAFANGNTQSYSYYMRSQSGCTGQLDNGTTSATLNSIYVTTTGVLGQATINWNSHPLLPTSAATGYDVQTSYLTGNSLSLLTSTLGLTANEVINDCDTTLLHRIVLADNSGCTSESNIDTNTFTYLGNVVDNPDLRCVSVLPNGQIQLEWLTPLSSSANFNEFEIYRNSGAGFVLYDSVSNFNQVSWTDAFANGNAQSYSYYMRSQSGCTGQVDNGATSATLNSIYVTTTGVLGQATINWNAHPLLPTSAATGYDVQTSYLTGNSLSLLTSTLGLTANEVINDCDTTLLHRIVLVDNSGCTSESNIDTNTFTYLGNVVDNPDLRCVSVLPNGQIQLEWLTPLSSSVNFNEFEIYRNSGAGFVLYDSVSNFNQVSWTDAFANGNAQSYSYYMRTQSGCTGQVDNGATSATLNSIYVTTTGVLGQATINWNAHPLLPTSAATGYDVQTSYLTGNSLSLLTSTLGLTANEVINDCDTTLLHRIVLADNSGCTSESNIDTNTFTYLGNVVDNPDLRCVSVLPNGQIQLEWLTPLSSSVNFNEFEIYRNSGAGFVLYDSVSNFNQVSWTDAFANGNAQSYSYYMRSQSGCTGQVDNGATSTTLNSIYVTTTGVLGQATINWNAHPLLPTSAATGYDVQTSYLTGNSLTLLTSTLGLTANEVINNCDTTLLHRVVLVDNSGCTSESNVDTNNFTYIGNVIDHPELRCASVLPNGQVQLTWVNPTPGTWDDFNQYNLYRNTGAGFVLIDSIEINSTSTYLDAGANGNAGSVSYYLQTKSGCTGQTDPSAIGGAQNGNTISTIYLVVSGGNTTIATLNWNAVTNPLLPTSTNTYIIEKENPGGSGSWSVVANVNTTSWQENLVLCIDSINYRVSIGDNQGCTSLSNVDGEIFVDHTIPAPPSPRCASVQTNGNVILTWVAPVDTGMRFGNYTIYKSSSINGPYVPVTTISNYNTLTYTDAGANAQAASIFYFMTTQTDCGQEISPGSDTLQTIKVDVFNNNGVAVITWNPLHNPELATATQNYAVYKEYPLGTWSVIGSTTAPVYQWFDTINVCEAIINYRVETGDLVGCTSNSSTDGDLFRDITRPTVSLLDTVSLDPLNPSQVSVSWLPSPSGDVVGYIIYQFNGASWDSIGSVVGINASYFLHNNPAAEFASQRYSIAAYDSCRNISNIGTSHNTLFITAKLDICRSAIDLRWNPYINMVNSVAQYNIYVSENGAPFSFLASVPGSNITYSHTTLNNGSEYCYYVQAQGNTVTRTASSNKACEIANLLTLPTFSYLKKATVVDVRRVVVECLVDTADNPDVSKYKLQRAFEKNGPFITVGAISYTGDPIITFNDFSARTDQYSYYYRVITIDSCGNDVLISNVGRTILLSGKPEFNLINELVWNYYEEWLGDVSKYSLFRSVDGIWSPTPIVTVNNGILEYNDDVTELYKYPNYNGRFCYRIEAYEGAGNTYGFTDTSSSNIFCLVQEPHLFIPSAFTPGGKNPIFKPEFIYIDAKNYFFAVFNRWGQKVYETRIPGEGWNGLYNDKIAPEGTYVYTVRIFGTNGQEIEKSGSVTLLR